jgi:hypothetical protein
MAFQWPTGSYQETKHGVSINARLLDKNETAALFDGYGKRLIQGRNSTIPLKIEIINNSDALMVLKESDITLPLVNINPSASWNIGSIVGTGLFRLVGGSVVIALGLPFALVGGVLVSTAIVGAASPYVIAGPLISVGALFTGVGSWLFSPFNTPVAQKNMQDQTEPIAIYPQETKDIILFTSARTLQPFSVSMKNLAGHKTSFAVNFDGVAPEREVTWMGARAA